VPFRFDTERDQHIARLKARIAGLTTANDLVSGSGNGSAFTTRERSRTDLRQPLRQSPTANLQPSTDRPYPPDTTRQTATAGARLAPPAPVADKATGQTPVAARVRRISQPPTANRQISPDLGGLAPALVDPGQHQSSVFVPGAFARRHHRPVAGVRYTPRRPEDSILHRIVGDNLPAFLDHAEQASGGLRFPRFVVDELTNLLSCGRIRRGLALFRCDCCNAARAIPLSCKSRSICPSCGSRRMTHLSAHLVDNVIPFVPVRFWVITFPLWLRRKIAYNHDLYRQVIAIVDRHICSFYQRQAAQNGIDNGRTGSVHVEQLCGSALNAYHRS